MGREIVTDQRLGPDFVPDKTRTAFLDIARGLAAILVVYTHIYDVYIRDHKEVRTPPTDALDNALVIPLKLDEQGIGAIAVPIFFIISGFVVTPIAMRMGPGRFGINRAFRIFPLLVFVVGFSAVLVALGHSLLATNQPEVNVGTVLANISLWNFIDRPFGSWVGVAWTLAVEVLFYAMLVAVLPLLRTRVWLAIAVQLEVVLILLITYRAFGDEYRALVINMVYTLIPIMGQAIWAAWARKIPAWLAGTYVTVAWLMFVWAGHLDVDPNYIPRPFPIAIALMLFLIGLFAEPYLRQRRFWTELSERTYSIYLLHGSVAFPLMHWLFNKLPLWLTVSIAVVATAIAAELSYRFIERPSHNLARRLSRRGQPRDPDPPEPDEDDDYDPDDLDELDQLDDGEYDYEGEEPTEKTPPVAPPPRRLRPPPRPVPRPTPVPLPIEVRTERIEPVAPPLRRAPAPHNGTPAGGRRRAMEDLPQWPTTDEPRPHTTNGQPPRSGGRRRAEDILNGHRPNDGLNTNQPNRPNGNRPPVHPADLNTPNANQANLNSANLTSANAHQANGNRPHVNPANLKPANLSPANGDPTHVNPANANQLDINPSNIGPVNGSGVNGSLFNGQINDGQPNGHHLNGDRANVGPDVIQPSGDSGGRRRRAEPAPAPASVAWPDDVDDPDHVRPPGGGRHRSD